MLTLRSEKYEDNKAGEVATSGGRQLRTFTHMHVRVYSFEVFTL